MADLNRARQHASTMLGGERLSHDRGARNWSASADSGLQDRRPNPKRVQARARDAHAPRIFTRLTFSHFGGARRRPDRKATAIQMLGAVLFPSAPPYTQLRAAAIDRQLVSFEGGNRATEREAVMDSLKRSRGRAR